MSSDPESVQEREEDGQRTLVRCAGRYTSEDVHRALFEEASEARTREELKEGVCRYVQSRQARR